ncbi:MAG: hypothetical protein Kow0069_36370 [Promethearchaeota archaeon]
MFVDRPRGVDANLSSVAAHLAACVVAGVACWHVLRSLGVSATLRGVVALLVGFASAVALGDHAGYRLWPKPSLSDRLRLFTGGRDPRVLYGATRNGRLVAFVGWRLTALNNQVRANSASLLTMVARTGVPLAYRFVLFPNAAGRRAVGGGGGRTGGGTGRGVDSTEADGRGACVAFLTYAEARSRWVTPRVVKKLSSRVASHAAALNALLPTMPHQRLEPLSGVDLVDVLAAPVAHVAASPRPAPVPLRPWDARWLPLACFKALAVACWAGLLVLTLATLPVSVPPLLSRLLASCLLAWGGLAMLPEAFPLAAGRAGQFVEHFPFEGVVDRPCWRRRHRRAREVEGPGGRRLAVVTLACDQFPAQPAFRLRVKIGAMERVLQKHGVPHEFQVHAKPAPVEFLAQNPHVLSPAARWRFFGGSRPAPEVDGGPRGSLVEKVHAAGGFFVATVTLSVFASDGELDAGGDDLASLGRDTLPAAARLLSPGVEPRSKLRGDRRASDLVARARRRATVAGNALVQMLGARPRDANFAGALHFQLLPTTALRRGGTRLPFAAWFGAELGDLFVVPDELKKVLPTVVAAEFNTPLNLPVDLPLGRTVNTEFNSPEAPFGLSRRHLSDKVLIVGGSTWERRETASLLLQRLLPLEFPGVAVLREANTVAAVLAHARKLGLQNRVRALRPNVDFWVHLFFPDQSGPPVLGEGEQFLRDVAHAAALAFRIDRREEAFVYAQLLDVRKQVAVDVALSGIQEKVGEIQEANHSAVTIHAEGLQLLEQLCAGGWASLFESKGEDVPELADALRRHGDELLLVDLSQLPPEAFEFASLLVLVKLAWLSRVNRPSSKFLYLPGLDSFFQGYQSPARPFSPSDPFFSWVDLLRAGGVALWGSVGYFSYLPAVVAQDVRTFLVHRVTSPSDAREVAAATRLENFTGTGHYSPKRQDAYQLEYLARLPPGCAIVKLSDVHDPFPVELDSPAPSPCDHPDEAREYVAAFMEEVHGVAPPPEPEPATLAPTSLERDLLKHRSFVEAVVQFGQALAEEVRDLGGVPRTALADLLSKRVVERARSMGMDPKADAWKLREVVDDLLDVLVERRYLLPHYETIGADESMAPTYLVGPKFTEALSEYWSVHVKTGVEPGEESLGAPDALDDLPRNVERAREGDPTVEVVGDPPRGQSPPVVWVPPPQPTAPLERGEVETRLRERDRGFRAPAFGRFGLKLGSLLRDQEKNLS